VECGEGVSPPTGEGFGLDIVPLPEKKRFFNWTMWRYSRGISRTCCTAEDLRKKEGGSSKWAILLRIFWRSGKGGGMSPSVAAKYATGNQSYRRPGSETVKCTPPPKVRPAEKIGDAENARLENAGLELSAPNCRGGKCRTGNIGTI